MLEKEENKEYLPIEGLADFRKATMDLMLGPNSKAAQEVRRPPLGNLSRPGRLQWAICISGSIQRPKRKLEAAAPPSCNIQGLFRE